MVCKLRALERDRDRWALGARLFGPFARGRRSQLREGPGVEAERLEPECEDLTLVVSEGDLGCSLSYLVTLTIPRPTRT